MPRFPLQPTRVLHSKATGACHFDTTSQPLLLRVEKKSELRLEMQKGFSCFPTPFVFRENLPLLDYLTFSLPLFALH